MTLKKAVLATLVLLATSALVFAAPQAPDDRVESVFTSIEVSEPFIFATATKAPSTKAFEIGCLFVPGRFHFLQKRLRGRCMSHYLP